MTAAPAAIPADAGRVLRRAILGWGLGHALLGRSQLAAALLAAELLGLALVGSLVATLAETTWYLVPFLAGAAFLTAWAGQAVHAYRAAQRLLGAIGPASRGSPAASAAWLAVPVLVWGTAFWLIAATAATPAAVLDRFVTAWPDAGTTSVWGEIATSPDRLQRQASEALASLREHCDDGELGPDCGEASVNLLRNVRIRIVTDDGVRAAAVAELVRYQRQPSRFLGWEVGSELVPVSVDELVTFDLEALPAPVAGLDIGARRWIIVNASAT